MTQSILFHIQIWEIKKKYISKNTRKISTMRVRRFVPCPGRFPQVHIFNLNLGTVCFFSISTISVRASHTSHSVWILIITLTLLLTFFHVLALTAWIIFDRPKTSVKYDFQTGVLICADVENISYLFVDSDSFCQDCSIL
jgi:hypothetical protein